MRAVSKRISQTVNSNGTPRTVINIMNRSNDEVIRTQAVSTKENPEKFNVVQQKIEKENNGTIKASEKMYKMKDADVIRLFKSAEMGNLENFGAIPEDKKKKKKHLIKTKTKSKTKSKTKTHSDKEKDKKVVLKKLKSKVKMSKKKMKGGNYDASSQMSQEGVRGFDPTNSFRDLAPFQTVEQERQQKGGNLKEAVEVALNSDLKASPSTPSTPVVVSGGRKFKKINKKE